MNITRREFAQGITFVAAGPELRRLYALAGELGVPILVHFQEVPHTPTEGTFATGFKNF
jgi:hypothetical protein